MTYLVEAQDLCKSYGSKKALDGLNLSIPSGKVIGLLGPNGAGKSTLLKIIAGVARPDSGDIEVLNQKPNWSLNNEIAYLPDRGRWYAFQTVNQALLYANAIFPQFDLVRAQEMAEVLGLDPNNRISSLSKGFEARLNLIFCLARRVQLVLLDEPFSGIDLVSREKIIQMIIDSLMERSQTLIISTHEIHESESLFDYVVFLDQGKQIYEGDTEELRAIKGSVESVYRGLFS